jgi:transketolase
VATVAETSTKLETYRELARQLRIDSIRCSTAAGSGHPTSSLSAADLMAVLLVGHLRYDFAHPDDPANDHLIFSKGHASPLVYALFKAGGAIGDDELMTFRKFGSKLEGHPTPVLPWVDVATGSLGQGLPIGVGVALAGKRPLDAPYHVWVLVGDSETAEGSIWEAFDHAGHEGLANLTAIVDVNRLGQRGPTELEWDMAAYAARVRAFGVDPIVIDGHDLAEIDDALARARRAERPTAVLARTVKGKGVSFLENKEGWHGKALDADQAKQAIVELGGETRSRTFPVAKPERWEPRPLQRTGSISLKTYSEPIATRKAYGEALAALGAARRDVVVLDAEVSNSTHAEDFKKTAPDRFFEMYIAEQQMVAAAVGMQVVGLVPFASTFAAFFTRAYDFIRMAAVSRADIRLAGSHAGVSIGEDGPSQMGLEDLAMMRAVHGSTVLYPCDGNQTARLVAQMADRRGITYLRTTREKTPVLYSPSEEFPIGWCKVVRGTEKDRVTIVAAGITLHEAVKAYDVLKTQDIVARIIDLYTVKPIDADALADAAKVTGGRFVVVEDHWAEGGLGEAVLAALAEKGVREVRYRHLAVRKMPGSGKPAELLDDAGISTVHIVRAAKALLG